MGWVCIAEHRSAERFEDVVEDLSTAEHADRILVVDHGRVVEDGNHAELVAKGGYYSSLYRQWTAGREVRSA